MTLSRGKLANIDRALLAELTDEEGSQPSRLPISAPTWSAWNRYCDVVGIPMGRAIVAMINLELASVVDEDLENESAVIAEKKPAPPDAKQFEGVADKRKLLET